MGKRTLPRDRTFVRLIILSLLAIGGLWFFPQKFESAEAASTSPVLVFLLSPSSGEEVSIGSFVQVRLQASAPGGIASSELFVDGKSLGTVSDSPESASWTWQALPAGIHTLSARTTSRDGETGQSQAVIVNVLALSEAMDIMAGSGQTLAQVGKVFGVPASQMAGANPRLDPSKPLRDGQTVKVPVKGMRAQPPVAGGFPLTIVWELKLTRPAKQSYCYLLSSDGVWARIPKSPFFFFQSPDNLYTQVFDNLPHSEVLLKAQCWGWIEGTLESLGGGQTRFDATRDPGKLVIAGNAFQLAGQPQYKPIPKAAPATVTVPPPYALREPVSAAECTDHGDILVGPFVCNTLMSAPVKEYIILIWEWQPGISSPVNTVINEINGYKVYRINPFNNSRTYMKDVTPAATKVTALPLPFGSYCYGVEAYATDPQTSGTLVSAMDTYCPGQPPTARQVIEDPSNWITTGGQWFAQDCNLKIPFYSFDQPAVLVGKYITDYEGGCYREGSYSGGVKFPLDGVPPGAAVHKATLKFSTILMDYGSPFVETNFQPNSCVDAVGTARQDWTGWDAVNHYSKTKSLQAVNVYTPLVTISGMSSDIDVTTVVSSWIRFPENNNGFILVPMDAPYPTGGGTGKCLSGVGNFQLVIDYFAP